MANFRAIAAVSEALAGLILDRCPDELRTARNVAVYQPRNFDSPMDEGFSVLLFRVAINGSIRNLTHRRDADGRRFRPSLPLDLHYLITPWAPQGSTQNRMLGWVMRMLEDQGTLSASHLNHYIGGAAVFGANEAADIVCDPLALNDYLNLWDRLKNLPASAIYVLRMVVIDSDQALDEGPPVQTRQFDMGEVVP
jgi:hypothetical protein